MNTKQQGDLAESKVCEYLKKRGYKIVSRNWKNKYCEIDIVAQGKAGVVFVEVKFRTTDYQGGGIDYITPQKQKQMAFAAEMWVNSNNWLGEYCLAAVEVSGKDLEVGELLFIA